VASLHSQVVANDVNCVSLDQRRDKHQEATFIWIKLADVLTDPLEEDLLAVIDISLAESGLPGDLLGSATDVSKHGSFG